jgi:hypothetical protein
MKPEIKQRWVEALRSGQYRQGTGALRAHGHYCCLGVLCDLAIQDEVLPGWEHFNSEGCDTTDPLAWQGDFLPERVRDWAGLSNVNPRVEDPEEEGEDVGLSIVNDERQCSFSRIANIIEAQL